MPSVERWKAGFSLLLFLQHLQEEVAQARGGYCAISEEKVKQGKVVWHCEIRKGRREAFVFSGALQLGSIMLTIESGV